jgi:hypothetical protein
MEQAVIVHLYPDVDNEKWGVDLVEDPLIEAIEERGVGEFDGHDIALDGSGEVILYAYGPDADALYQVMEPILREVPPRCRLVCDQALRRGWRHRRTGSSNRVDARVAPRFVSEPRVSNSREHGRRL